MTGATGLLGSAVIGALASEFRCIVTFRDRQKFERLLATHADLEGIETHLDEASIARAFGEAAPWSVLHLAGAWGGGTLADTSDEDWSRMMDANLHSAFRVLRQAMRSLPDGGRFVAVASAAAMDNRTGMAGYVVAKSALVTMIRNAAAEAQGRLAINAVAPDTIASQFSGGVAPDDIAETLRYLLSPAGGAISGAVIPMYEKPRTPSDDARARES